MSENTINTKSVSNLTLNKKGTKVKITGKPKYFNVLGTFVQWLPPLAYLSVKFDLFTFQNANYAITGWGFIFAVGLFIAFRQKIKDKLKEYEDSFGSMWNRSKSGNISLAIATTLFLVSILSTSLFIIFFIYSTSTYASLFIYGPYDAINGKRIEMQKLLDEKLKAEDFKTLTEQFDKLNV